MKSRPLLTCTAIAAGLLCTSPWVARGVIDDFLQQKLGINANIRTATIDPIRGIVAINGLKLRDEKSLKDLQDDRSNDQISVEKIWAKCSPIALLFRKFDAPFISIEGLDYRQSSSWSDAIMQLKSSAVPADGILNQDSTFEFLSCDGPRNDRVVATSAKNAGFRKFLNESTTCFDDARKRGKDELDRLRAQTVAARTNAPALNLNSLRIRDEGLNTLAELTRIESRWTEMNKALQDEARRISEASAAAQERLKDDWSTWEESQTSQSKGNCGKMHIARLHESYMQSLLAELSPIALASKALMNAKMFRHSGDSESAKHGSAATNVALQDTSQSPLEFQLIRLSGSIETPFDRYSIRGDIVRGNAARITREYAKAENAPPAIAMEVREKDKSTSRVRADLSLDRVSTVSTSKPVPPIMVRALIAEQGDVSEYHLRARNPGVSFSNLDRTNWNTQWRMVDTIHDFMIRFRNDRWECYVTTQCGSSELLMHPTTNEEGLISDPKHDIQAGQSVCVWKSPLATKNANLPFLKLKLCGTVVNDRLVVDRQDMECFYEEQLSTAWNATTRQILESELKRLATAFKFEGTKSIDSWREDQLVIAANHKFKQQAVGEVIAKQVSEARQSFSEVIRESRFARQPGRAAGSNLVR